MRKIPVINSTENEDENAIPLPIPSTAIPETLEERISFFNKHLTRDTWNLREACVLLVPDDAWHLVEAIRGDMSDAEYRNCCGLPMNFSVVKRAIAAVDVHRISGGHDGLSSVNRDGEEYVYPQHFLEWAALEHLDGPIPAEIKDYVLRGPTVTRAKRTNVSAPVTFATPRATTWADVTIRFQDGATVTVEVKDMKARYSAKDMGMASKRSLRPTKAWGLLRDLAEEHGFIGWSSNKSDSKNKSRKATLNGALKTFFQIEGDPVVVGRDDRGGKGYKVLFNLVAER